MKPGKARFNAPDAALAIRRFARDKATGRGVCPAALAFHQETIYTDHLGDPTDRDHPQYAELDDGGTSPLCGIVSDQYITTLDERDFWRGKPR